VTAEFKIAVPLKFEATLSGKPSPVLVELLATINLHMRASACVGECPVIGYLFTGPTTAARPGLVEVTGRVALTSAAHCSLVWLSSGMRPAGHRGAERLKRGLPSSK
jgi:hypothetical protein